MHRNIQTYDVVSVYEYALVRDDQFFVAYLLILKNIDVRIPNVQFIRPFNQKLKIWRVKLWHFNDIET